jgi:hypothetical protein
MKLNILAASLFLASSAIGFGAANGGAALAPNDEQSKPPSLTTKSRFVNVPGGNAFEGAPAAGNPISDSTGPSVPSTAVPEPSAIALIGLGVLGVGLLKFRRRA